MIKKMLKKIFFLQQISSRKKGLKTLIGYWQKNVCALVSFVDRKFLKILFCIIANNSYGCYQMPMVAAVSLYGTKKAQYVYTRGTH